MQPLFLKVAHINRRIAASYTYSQNFTGRVVLLQTIKRKKNTVKKNLRVVKSVTLHYTGAILCNPFVIHEEIKFFQKGFTASRRNYTAQNFAHIEVGSQRRFTVDMSLQKKGKKSDKRFNDKFFFKLL